MMRSFRVVPWIFACSIAAACVGDEPGGSGPGAAPDGGSSTRDGESQPTPSSPALALAALPVIVLPGVEARIPVSITRTALDVPVKIGLSALPSGLSVTSLVLQSGQTQGELVLTALPDTAQARLQVQVTAESELATTSQSLAITVRGPAGSVDTTFGAAGFSQVLPGLDGNAQIGIDSGDRIVVSRFDSSSKRCSVARLSSDGQPDPGFGTEGVTQLDQIGVCFGVVKPDSSVYLYGSVKDPSPPFPPAHNFLARLNPAGALDLGFGVGGILELEQGEGEVIDMRIEPSGGLLFATRIEGSAVRLQRVDAAGELDTTYDRRTAEFTSPDALVLAADGTPVVTGSALTPEGSFRMAFALLGEGVAPVTSLGDAWKYGTSTNGVTYDAAGRLLIAGSGASENNQIPDQALVFGLASRLKDGKFDPSFHEYGTVSELLGGAAYEQTVFRSVFEEPSGNLLFVGLHMLPSGAGTHPILVRYHPDGQRDATFGTDGLMEDTASAGYVYGASMQRLTPTVVVARQDNSGTSQTIGLRRYWR